MNRPIFVTGNAYKVKYLELWLGLSLKHHELDLAEIQSLDLKEVVTHKALEAYKRLRQPVLVEDVALTLQALGRLPGPLIKWFLTELDAQGICHLLDAYSDRAATAETMYGLHDGRTVHYFLGQTHGRIAKEPRGSFGFGWNATFIPEGSSKTYAEMTDTELKPYSHRAEAIAKLREFLDRRHNGKA